MRAENDKARVLTVWGGSGSGKTTLVAKLAAESEARGADTVVLLCDDVVPEMPMLSEFEGEDETRRSLGLLLDMAGDDMTGDAVYDSLVIKKGFSHTAFLGYAYGENLLSYPPPTKGQAKAVLSAIRDICEVAIVSAPTAFCTSTLAMTAASASDLSACLVTPDIKSLAFLFSNGALFPAYADKQVRILNHPENIQAMYDWGSYPSDFVLPFSAEISGQGRERRLLESVSSAGGMAYRQAVSDIYDLFAAAKEDEVHEG
ncbi:MAG: ParA family protein [Clostridiales Family XIII bacterium]|jgi:RecA/RadA recombinase|nr:ParA family protein [Clostridiales Family XIII bacterium]